MLIFFLKGCPFEDFDEFRVVRVIVYFAGQGYFVGQGINMVTIENNHQELSFLKLSLLTSMIIINISIILVLSRHDIEGQTRMRY